MTKAAKREDSVQGAGITHGLAAYVVGSRFEDIPAEVRHEAVRSLINCIGCCVAGSRHETVDAAVAALKDLGASGDAVKRYGLSTTARQIDADAVEQLG